MDLLAELIPKMHYSEASPGMDLLAEPIPKMHYSEGISWNVSASRTDPP